MKPRRHAQFHLPPLDPAEALVAVHALERAIAAIWRAHGDRMAVLLHQRTAARARAPSQYVDDGNPAAPDDLDF